MLSQFVFTLKIRIKQAFPLLVDMRFLSSLSSVGGDCKEVGEGELEGDGVWRGEVLRGSGWQWSWNLRQVICYKWSLLRIFFELFLSFYGSVFQSF